MYIFCSIKISIKFKIFKNKYYYSILCIYMSLVRISRALD